MRARPQQDVNYRTYWEPLTTCWTRWRSGLVISDSRSGVESITSLRPISPALPHKTLHRKAALQTINEERSEQRGASVSVRYYDKYCDKKYQYGRNKCPTSSKVNRSRQINLSKAFAPAINEPRTSAGPLTYVLGISIFCLFTPDSYSSKEQSERSPKSSKGKKEDLGACETDMAEKRIKDAADILGVPTLSESCDRVHRNVNSTAADVIFATTRGMHQYKPEINKAPAVTPEDHFDSQRASQRQRKFEALEAPLHPYRKKIWSSNFDYGMKATPARHNTLKEVHAKDSAWKISCAFLLDMPMLDIVDETQRRSQEVVNECGEKYALVTYDLAIAKPALQIQAAETSRFDIVFMCFGVVHIQMTYFVALGHIIEEPGEPQVLADTDALAAGSLKGFLSGRHYNRCKRLHLLLASAFRVLHLRSLIAKYGAISATLLNQLEKLKDQPAPQTFEDIQKSTEFINFLEKYDGFTDDTRSMSDLPVTNGGVAKAILLKICAHAKQYAVRRRNKNTNNTHTGEVDAGWSSCDERSVKHSGRSTRELVAAHSCVYNRISGSVFYDGMRQTGQVIQPYQNTGQIGLRMGTSQKLQTKLNTILDKEEMKK
ncbi:hypothetical protein Hamer_G001684 [Homarus americanus]|uniref:Uncharacterized protein n=1 Tax=Homarus americanus TaxID=6706 RepID=A0A8J5JRJ5_HOMAM|nr:hypothetical protein Hamer_G001684 [Homarus americanus]